MTKEQLIVYTKTQYLFYEFYPVLRNYPKSEKFSLCKHIKDSFVGLLKSISLGNSVKSKRLYHLQEADAQLETLTVLVDLSKRMKYISKGFYENVDEKLTEIKKLLVGYIKSSVKR